MILSIKNVSVFWYKRTCEIGVLIAVVILAIFGMSLILLHSVTEAESLVPLAAVISAAVTGVVGVISYIWSPSRWLAGLGFINYLCMAIAVGTLVYFTGMDRSPYLVMWMLLSIFAGLYGRLGLGSALIATNALIIYKIGFASAVISVSDVAMLFLTLELPLAASYLIWRERGDQDTKKTKTLDALTQQLSQVANKSEIVINSITEGVVAIDAQGAIQLINPAAQKLLGWQRQDAIGLDYRSVIKLIGINGKELPDEATPIRQVLTSGAPIVNNDLALMSVGGKKKLLSVVVSPVNGVEHTIAGAIAVFRDITNEKLEERQKAEFISTASHEMRTPVAAIEGYLGLALNPTTAAIDDKARAFLLKAQEATQHLGTLFQDLLTVSRAEDNRLIPKQTVIDMIMFVREITESLMAKAQAKGLFLYFKPNETAASPSEEKTTPRVVLPIFYVYADQGHLREVINNLIDNAIKYTKQGSVAVDVTGDMGNVFISVADTGIGIPPEDTPHLFQKFYRIDNSDTREIGGTGLGLYISRRLIEANNGRVWVASTYGKGSTFYIQLPRISHEKATELAQPAAPTKPRSFMPTNTIGGGGIGGVGSAK